MSNPSFSNIDRWLFELNEGNLSPEQIQQLEAFLLRHPELDVDRDMWELARVEKEEVVYPGQKQFIRRRPVGLYMAAGMVSIALFVLIGIDLQLQGFNSSASKLLVEKADNAFVEPQGQNVKPGENNLLAPKSTHVAAENSDEAFDLALKMAQLRTELNEAQGALDQLITNQVDEYEINAEALIQELKTSISRTVEMITYLDHKDDDQAEEHQLTIHPVRELNSPDTRHWSPSLLNAGNARFSRPEHNESFSSRWSKMSRSVRRMLDHPVALKNLKDPVFHLPGMLPSDVNFGNTGTLPATRIQSLSRLQWYGNENAQISNRLAFDGYVYSIRGGLGVQFNNSYYGNGQIVNSNIALTYAPKFSVSRNILIEPSIRFKMGNKMLDEDKLSGIGLSELDRENVQEFYPSGTSPVGRQLWYRDLGTAIMVNTKWFFTGLQMDNIFRHYDNIYSGNEGEDRRAGIHFVATIGTDYESKKEQFGLSPYLIYQKSERLEEFWGGISCRFHWFTVGGAVSDKLDLSGSAGFKLSRFSINYQADYLHSTMLSKQLLSHQLVLKFITFNPNKRQKFLTL